MLAPYLIERKPELCDCAGLEVLHEHVRLREHGCKQRLVIAPCEVKAGGFLPAVEPDEIGAFALRQAVVVTCEIPLGTLDLDDPCAGVCKPAAAHWSRYGLLQRQNQ